MLKNDLLENGYHFEVIEPKKRTTHLMWAVFELFIIFPILFIFYLVLFQDMYLLYIEFSATMINIMFIGLPFIYFITKEIITALFRSSRDHKEAFKTWQVVIIYCPAMIFMYSLLFLISLALGGNIYLLVICIIMSLFMSFDLTLLIYILLLKLRYNADYVAINNHMYSITLYSKENIKRRVYSDIIKDKLYKVIKSIKDSMPPMKKIFIPLIAAAVLTVSISYFVSNKEIIIKLNPADFDNYLEYCDATRPVIKKYDGDIYSSHNQPDGEYTGCEILAGQNIIYCNDDDSVIYYDSEKHSVMRLDNMDKTERLCIYEECRNNPGKYCGHMPNFVSNGCYSDGILYGVRQYMSTDKKGLEILKSYIIRYDIDSNKTDKLIEFEMGDEDAYIKNMFVCYNYLYAVASTNDMLNLTVARIDLTNEEACLLYSDTKSSIGGAINKDKIKNLMYNKNNILSFDSGVLYSCVSDMTSFSPVSSFGYGNITYFDIHGKNIYYFTDYRLYGYIFNDDRKEFQTKLLADIETKESATETVMSSVTGFCTDGDFLYYTTGELHTLKAENGVIIESSAEYRLNEFIYRVKLDSSLELYDIDFSSKVAVFEIDPGDYLENWSVKDGYIYFVMYSNGQKSLSRVKINANSEPYIFWYYK